LKKNPNLKTFQSDLSQKTFPIEEKVFSATIRHSLNLLIRTDHPELAENFVISIEELNYYREKYITEKLEQQLGELSELEKTVIQTMTNQTSINKKSNVDKHTPLTRGQKLADKVASFGGSWTFISSFGVFLVIWIICNFYFLSNRGFDPYPFILLNLILSCIAALQAPIIMMSQNRQEEKDRERAKMDYMINLKSELEIRTLHEKIDHLILHQQKNLLDLQVEQIELLENISLRVQKK
jgi:uncharacterized membrane protein